MTVFNDIENAFSVENFGYLVMKCHRQAKEISRLIVSIKDYKRIISKISSKKQNRKLRWEYDDNVDYAFILDDKGERTRWGCEGPIEEAKDFMEGIAKILNIRSEFVEEAPDG